MTTARDIRLSASQRAIKLAVADATSDAGGQVFVSRELGCAQSRLSDYSSVNTADFMTLDKALRLDQLAGAPVIVSALCRLSGGSFVPDETADGDAQPLEFHLSEVAGEMADVVRKLAVRIGHRREMSPTARDELLRETNQAIDALTAMRCDVLGDDLEASLARVTQLRRESS